MTGLHPSTQDPISVDPEYIAFLDKQKAETEALVDELQQLMSHYSQTLQHEGVLRHLEMIERWLEKNQQGLIAARRVAELAPAWLGEMHQRLVLASDELKRLEAESGNPIPPAETQKIDELAEVQARVDKVTTGLAQLLCQAGEKHNSS
jgi:Lon protease-like protein